MTQTENSVLVYIPMRAWDKLCENYASKEDVRILVRRIVKEYLRDKLGEKYVLDGREKKSII